MECWRLCLYDSRCRCRICCHSRFLHWLLHSFSMETISISQDTLIRCQIRCQYRLWTTSGICLFHIDVFGSDSHSAKGFLSVNTILCIQAVVSTLSSFALSSFGLNAKCSNSIKNETSKLPIMAHNGAPILKKCTPDIPIIIAKKAPI